MTNAATWMPEKRTQTPSPSPDLIPAKTINRKLTLELAHQLGALQNQSAHLRRNSDGHEVQKLFDRYSGNRCLFGLWNMRTVSD